MPSEILTKARHGANVALSFFYPEVCQYCREQRALSADGYICPRCWRHLQFIRPPFCERCGLPFEGEITTAFQCSNCHDMNLQFIRARSAVAAQGMALDIIHRWKYRQELWFEPFLTELLVREARPQLQAESWDCLVPVPLHPLKEREREFNQALRLARGLSAALGLPICLGAVRRVEPTRTQAQLSRTERRENVRKAFAQVETNAVKGKRVVLVDDVLTTGATTSACARVLRSAGAAEVCVWTVARGLIH